MTYPWLIYLALSSTKFHPGPQNLCCRGVPGTLQQRLVQPLPPMVPAPYRWNHHLKPVGGTTSPIKVCWMLLSSLES